MHQKRCGAWPAAARDAVLPGGTASRAEVGPSLNRTVPGRYWERVFWLVAHARPAAGKSDQQPEVRFGSPGQLSAAARLRQRWSACAVTHDGARSLWDSFPTLERPAALQSAPRRECCMRRCPARAGQWTRGAVAHKRLGGARSFPLDEWEEVPLRISVVWHRQFLPPVPQ